MKLDFFIIYFLFTHIQVGLMIGLPALYKH